MLYQSDFPSENTVYVVRYDFTLGGVESYDADFVVSHGGVSEVTIDGQRYFTKPIQLNSGQAIFTDRWLINPSYNALIEDGCYFADSITTVYIASIAEWEIKDLYKIMNFVEIPQGCILEFDGGSISSGAIKFNDTQLVMHKNSFNGCLFGGTVIGSSVNLSGFGPKCTSGVDDSWLVNSVINICDENGVLINFDFDNNLYIGTPSNLGSPYINAYQNQINIKPNTQIKQTSPGWIILQQHSWVGGVVRSAENHRNNSHITLEGLKVDANNIVTAEGYGENGICVSGVIKDCVIKNCVTGAGDNVFGGKGIALEAHGIDTFVDNCAVYNCWCGIFFNRTSVYGDDINMVVSNTITDGCHIALFAMNQDGSTHQSSFKNNNLLVNNCIFKDTEGTDGVICLSNVSGIQIKNTTVTGVIVSTAEEYAKAEENRIHTSLIRGNVQYSDIQLLVTQYVERMFDFAATRIVPISQGVINNKFDLYFQCAPLFIFQHTSPAPNGFTAGSLGNLYKLIMYSSGYTKVFADASYLANCQDIVEYLSSSDYFNGSIQGLYAEVMGLTLNNCRPIGGRTVGGTAQRPTLTTGFNVGYMYFDTDLQKPIWWTWNTTLGGFWADATGNQS